MGAQRWPKPLQKRVQAAPWPVAADEHAADPFRDGQRKTLPHCEQGDGKPLFYLPSSVLSLKCHSFQTRSRARSAGIVDRRGSAAARATS